MKRLIVSILAIIVLSVMIFSFNNFLELSGKSLITAENPPIFNISKINDQEYLYEIYNNSGKIVKREVTSRIPTINYLSDSLLSIEIGAGTGLWLTQYYDIDKDIFSEVFESAIAIQNNRIVNIIVSDYNYKLVVRDIFDKAEYYKEFIVDDFSPVVNPVDALINVELLDSDRLMITYLSGKNYDEKSVIFQL